jgi:hypothetical protein
MIKGFSAGGRKSFDVMNLIILTIYMDIINYILML